MKNGGVGLRFRCSISVNMYNVLVTVALRAESHVFKGHERTRQALSWASGLLR